MKWYESTAIPHNVITYLAKFNYVHYSQDTCTCPQNSLTHWLNENHDFPTNLFAMV